MVGVDLPIKALSMHKQNNCLSSTKIKNSFMHIFNVSTLYRQSIKLLSKAVVGVDPPIKALSMHIQKPYKGIIV